MPHLNKTLGTFSGAALMLNMILGTGILILPGLAAQQNGFLSIYSWLLACVVSIPLLAVIAYLARVSPGAGGIAFIAQKYLGDRMSLITSFLLLGAVGLGLPSIALTGGHYMSQITGVSPGIIATIFILIALIGNIAIPSLVKKIGTLSSILVLAFILILLYQGLQWHPPTLENLTNLSDALLPLPNNISLVLAPFMMIFFAFSGWEIAISMTEEFRNPYDTIPKAIWISFICVSLIYLTSVLVVLLTGVAAYHEAPFITVFHADPIYQEFISLGAALLISANLFSALWAVSRLVFSLARSHSLPSFFAQTHAGIPRRAVIGVSCFLLFVIGLDTLSLITLQALLTLAGQNFLLLNAIATFALLKTSATLTYRLSAILALIFILCLCLVNSLHLLYPLTLSLTACLAHAIFQQKKQM